ncbi:MAG: hypothetical protein DHS20C15_06180 [Planctomycetota bacterium]|nr:MAG: hypothetical protein DHS20C15_06180 [Planctomycetota bacterium]
MRVNWLISLLFVGLTASWLPAQGEPDDFAAEVLERFDLALDKGYVDQLQEAVQDIDLVYEKVSDKTRKKLNKALAGMLTSKPRQTIGEDGQSPEQLLSPSYAGAIGILHDKPGGVEILRKALKSKHLKEWYDVRGLLYEGIALSLDPDDISLIAKGLAEPDAYLVATAAGSLAIYSDQDVDVRREAIEELIDGWEALVETAEKNERREKGSEAREFLDQVEPALIEAAGDITRRRQSDLDALREWFAETGKGDAW